MAGTRSRWRTILKTHWSGLAGRLPGSTKETRLNRQNARPTAVAPRPRARKRTEETWKDRARPSSGTISRERTGNNWKGRCNTILTPGNDRTSRGIARMQKKRSPTFVKSRSARSMTMTCRRVQSRSRPNGIADGALPQWAPTEAISLTTTSGRSDSKRATTKNGLMGLVGWAKEAVRSKTKRIWS